MAKLKNIIRQLSKEDYQTIYDSLMEHNAEKSAYLLRYIHQEQLSDAKIMGELDVNTNAYYTLRSRLNQKIEEYLLKQIESPRTELLRKVANINEIVFTKTRTICITTLKKLEKELIDYDLSHELMLVYKTLKKLHVNTPDYFNYSQAYNRHVAYTLDVDNVEIKMAEYFKQYGQYSFTQDETEKLQLSLLNNEILNICKKYDSHRLYVYKNCVNVFHRLFVEPEDELTDDNIEPIEDIFNKIEKYFETYEHDTIYFHLKIILQFLRLEYYNHYRLYRKAEEYFEEVNDSIGSLLFSYNTHTFPARFLSTKLERHNRLNTQESLYEENQGLFHDFEPDKQNIPEYVIYVTYRALCQFYVGKYDEAIRWLNRLLNDVSLKKYAYVQLEIKLLLALLYCIIKDNELLTQSSNSIQRQIRLLGKETCIHAVLYIKMLKTANQINRNDRKKKISELMDKLKKTTMPQGFSLVKYIKLDENFLKRLL